MWVFTRNGFFSAVKHLDRPDCLLVRARFRGDLERLAVAHRIDMAITETPEADYRFRAVVRQADFARAMEAEARAVDYPNFKAAVHDGTARDAAYMGCWCAVRRGQEQEARA